MVNAIALEAYICPRCRGEWDSVEGAMGCCGIESFDGFQCQKCLEIFMDEKMAEDCCKNV